MKTTQTIWASISRILKICYEHQSSKDVIKCNLLPLVWKEEAQESVTSWVQTCEQWKDSGLFSKDVGPTFPTFKSFIPLPDLLCAPYLAILPEPHVEPSGLAQQLNLCLVVGAEAPMGILAFF